MIEKLDAIRTLADDIKDTIGVPVSTSLEGTVDNIDESKVDLVDNLTDLGVEASTSDPLLSLTGKVGTIIISPSVEDGELIFASGSNAEVEGSELEL